MADRGDVASTNVDTDGNITITFRDGTREFRSRDGHTATTLPDGTAIMRTPQGIETTTFPNGTVIGKGGPPSGLTMAPGNTHVDQNDAIHVYRHDGTHEQTNADGSTWITAPDGTWINTPPLPPPPVPPGGSRWTHTVQGTDGTRLEIDPDGYRTLISPDGTKESIPPPGRVRAPAPPIVTYDPDGTRHEHTNDGTHTIIEKVGDQDIRTVIPATPRSPQDVIEDLDAINWRNTDLGNDASRNPIPDGTVQRVQRDGRIDIVHTDGTVVHLPGLSDSARPDGTTGWVDPGPTFVDADGTIHRRLHDIPGPDRPDRGGHDHPGDVTTYTDGISVFDDGDKEIVVTDDLGTEYHVPRRFKPWIAGLVGTVLLTAAAGLATRDGDDATTIGPLASSVESTPARPICPTGGRALAAPCPPVDSVLDTTGDVTTDPSVETVPVASVAVPVSAAPSVADFAGRWVLESGLTDPTGHDVLWYAKDMTDLAINPTTAEFVIEADGQIRTGSYFASLTGQSACGLEIWSATFNEVEGSVGETGVGGINWSGTADLGGTRCFTAPDNNGNSANFWITGDTMVLCHNPMPSPTECAPGWQKSIFRRVP